MGRKPRLEFPGAIYHVTNRGGGRSELFGTAAAAKAFVACLFEASERMGWDVYAFCLARDRYDLALGTPRGNLVTGLHWLQSAFGNRLRGLGGEQGVRRRPAFKGRYQAFLVEPGAALGEVVDFIHWGPVREGVVPVERLGQFRWSSYRWLVGGRSEGWPTGLKRQVDDLAEQAGSTTRLPTFFGSGSESDPAHLPGHRPGLQQGNFGRIGVSWAYGSPEYRQGLLERLQGLGAGMDGAAERVRAEEDAWERDLEAGARVLGRDLGSVEAEPKGAAWKVALAGWMKGRSGVSNGWLGRRLGMGGADAVSRYVGELGRGVRAEAVVERAKLP